MPVLALLHPGSMGARIGGELVAAGHEVRWLTEGRSEATAARARTESLVPVDSAARLVDGADLVISVLPPQGALDAARLVAAAGFAGMYVDANPLSPGTLRRVRETVESTGAAFVDAGVVGPPPRDGHRTHLYLSGRPDRVSAVVTAVAGTRVTPVVVGTEVGAASAAKAAYALFNKGRMVLAAQATELADAYGVEPVLAAESDRTGAELLGDSAGLRDGLDRSGWRWATEMDELAATMRAVGLEPDTAEALAARLRRPRG